MDLAFCESVLLTCLEHVFEMEMNLEKVHGHYSP